MHDDLAAVIAFALMISNLHIPHVIRVSAVTPIHPGCRQTSQS